MPQPEIKAPRDSTTRTFLVRDYDLDATLSSGQSFRWYKVGETWHGVVQGHWVSLRSNGKSITASTPQPVADWDWLIHYAQLQVDLAEILSTFPADEPMRNAVRACHGLRLLRQDPWECLASFILSSTKQIVQIQQIVSLLAHSFGEVIVTNSAQPTARSFPTAERLARCTEAELRACKMGFRAPYLLQTSRRIAEGKLDLQAISQMPLEEARHKLMSLPGVGRKIADCALLFGFGFPAAFPVDVWVVKALSRLYFPNRRDISLKQLQRFSEEYFGPNGGYAQQYLFHYMRTRERATRTQRLVMKES